MNFLRGDLTQNIGRGCQMVCVRGQADLKEIDYDYDQEQRQAG